MENNLAQTGRTKPKLRLAVEDFGFGRSLGDAAGDEDGRRRLWNT